MDKLTRSAIKKRLILLSLFCATGIIVFLIFFYHSFSSSLIIEKEQQSKHLSEVGIGIIKYFYQLEIDKKLSTQEAQNLASNALKASTYEDNGYFWINSGKGILLMQPHTPERVGIDQTEWTDINNKYIFKDFIRKAKAGGGWVQYYWPKPHTIKEYSKISYVSYFEPWDWVLGTGLYLDEMEKNVYISFFKASGFFILGFIIFLISSTFTAKYFINQLEGLAIKDSLTGLFTKRFLEETIPIMLKRHARLKEKYLFIIFIDIDHFKKINDTYGHKVGDDVLSKIAQTIQQNTRPDDLCIRYGGEEFVIVGLIDDKNTLINFVERIKTATAKLVFTKKNITFSITLSAGITTALDHELFEDTILRADENLYQAKEKGRNCIVFK